MDQGSVLFPETTGRFRPMNRNVLIVLILTFAVVAGACSDDTAPPSVASLETASSTTSPGAAESDPLADSEAAMLAFTQCLRDQGIDVDDPTIDANGNLQLAPIAFEVETSSDDPEAMPDPSEFEALIGSCDEYLEGIVMNAAPVDTTEMEDSFLAYAACMRDNGVDMPDPDFSSGMIDLGGALDSDFEAADAACRYHLAALGLSEIEAP